MSIDHKVSISPLAEARAAAWPMIMSVAGLSLFVNLLVFVAPIYSLQVFDRVLSSRSTTTLFMLTAIAAFLFICSSAIEHYRSRALLHASFALDAKLSGPAFKAALAAARLHKTSQHAQFLRDVDSLREFVAGGAIIALLDAPWAPIFLSVCFLFHPLMGALATFGMASIIALSFFNEFLTKSPLVEASLQHMSAMDRLSSSLRNAEVIHGLGMKTNIFNQWNDSHRQGLAYNFAAHGRGSLMIGTSKLLRLMLQSGMLGLGAYLAIKQEISPGIIFAASLVMGRALAPIDMAVGQWKSIVAARSAYARLRRVFEVFPQTDDIMRYPVPNGDIAVESLAVAAPGKGYALIRNISFQLRAGETLAIVGKSGSGKSALSRALVGAWPAAQGGVRIGGYELGQLGSDQLGELLGYLPQDVELFAGTIRDNIGRFDRGASDAMIVQAAQLAGAHDMIQRLPNGYMTVIGDDGAGLAGGQRQRIGLARALFGSPLFVVLDEPNANLDGDGEVALLQAITTLRQQNVTTVIVTHKADILMACDKIAIMHEGNLVKFGSRDEMIPFVVRADRAPVPYPDQLLPAKHSVTTALKRTGS